MLIVDRQEELGLLGLGDAVRVARPVMASESGLQW